MKVPRGNGNFYFNSIILVAVLSVISTVINLTLFASNVNTKSELAELEGSIDRPIASGVGQQVLNGNVTSSLRNIPLEEWNIISNLTGVSRDQRIRRIPRLSKSTRVADYYNRRNPYLEDCTIVDSSEEKYFDATNRVLDCINRAKENFRRDTELALPWHVESARKFVNHNFTVSRGYSSKYVLEWVNRVFHFRQYLSDLNITQSEMNDIPLAKHIISSSNLNDERLASRAGVVDDLALVLTTVAADLNTTWMMLESIVHSTKWPAEVVLAISLTEAKNEDVSRLLGYIEGVQRTVFPFIPKGARMEIVLALPKTTPWELRVIGAKHAKSNMISILDGDDYVHLNYVRYVELAWKLYPDIDAFLSGCEFLDRIEESETFGNKYKETIYRSFARLHSPSNELMTNFSALEMYLRENETLTSFQDSLRQFYADWALGSVMGEPNLFNDDNLTRFNTSVIGVDLVSPLQGLNESEIDQHHPSQWSNEQYREELDLMFSRFGSKSYSWNHPYCCNSRLTVRKDILGLVDVPYVLLYGEDSTYVFRLVMSRLHVRCFSSPLSNGYLLWHKPRESL